MSKRKVTTVSYEDAVRNILNFVEGDDGGIENIPLPLIGNNAEFERGKYEQSSDEEHNDPVTQRRKKLLTRNRLFHNIDSALDLENYNQTHFINGNGHLETMTGYLVPNNKRDTETIRWTSKMPQVTGYSVDLMLL